jgi:uncharacterized membrane protein YedE/YeeE
MTKRLLVVLLAGVIFGAGLAIGGMTDPGRVIGFLDVAGDWDPSLAFVMAGAVFTYAALMLWRRKAAAGAGWFGVRLPNRETEPVNRRMVLGSVIFGVGWGLSGLCPGPAIANLGGLRMESFLFVPAMMAGMFLARRFVGADSE